MLPVSRCNTVGFRLVLALALLLTTWLSLTPSPGPLQESINDKLAHLGGFLLLSFLAHASWPERRFQQGALWWLAGYGLTIEITQYFIPNRFFSLLDILADGTGILLYTIIMKAVLRVIRPIVEKGG